MQAQNPDSQSFWAATLCETRPHYIDRSERLETTYLAPFPKSWTFCVWGIAKASNS